MTKNFIDELKWRGMLHDCMPKTKEHLSEKTRSAYIGFDPTSDSLHIGNLVTIMLLAHFQKCGHKPIVLVGGATGMIGDPSGKSSERNLLDESTLKHNQKAITKQLKKILDFTSNSENAAIVVNNYDWMKKFSFLEFIRDIGKHITLSYMIAKDSIKNRISSDAKEGISFTEFTYQLVQAYDFLYLFQNANATIQMGGSDQWGNITTGTELIRRTIGGKGYAITCPLITKIDGTKFGKSEGENIWLDPKRTSPYKFYQYWLNTSDKDAEKYIKIFTFLDQKTIKALIYKHREKPKLRILQKKIGEEVTLLVHGKKALENVVNASNILFGKSTKSDLKKLDEQTFIDAFEGVPQANVSIEEFKKGLNMIAVLSAKTGFLKSNRETIRLLKENAISVNKNKVKENFIITEKDLIVNKYILLQRGKKNYYLIIIND